MAGCVWVGGGCAKWWPVVACGCGNLFKWECCIRTLGGSACCTNWGDGGCGACTEGPKKRSLLLWFNALIEPLELFKVDKLLELLELLEGTDNDGVRGGPLLALLKLVLFKLLFISPLLSTSGWAVGPGIFCLFTMHLFTFTTPLLALGGSAALSKLAFGGGVAPFCPSFCNRFTNSGLDIAIFPPDDADGLLGGLLVLTPGEVT